MLLRTDYRPDFDDASQCVDKDRDEPLLVRESVGTSVRRLKPDCTKACASTMWPARCTSPSATPWEEMAASAPTTVINALNVEECEQIMGALSDGRLLGRQVNV